VKPTKVATLPCLSTTEEAGDGATAADATISGLYSVFSHIASGSFQAATPTPGSSRPSPGVLPHDKPDAMPKPNLILNSVKKL